MKLSIFIFLLNVVSSYAQHDVRQTTLRVREYLERSFSSSSSIAQKDANINAQLQNSNKIGMGYNPTLGSPVCYTGTCQMEGFARPIFNLSFINRPNGACTTQMIPENVDIDCLPSADISSSTEILQTVDKLFESISNGIDFSSSAKYMGVSFSYKYSSQTRSIIDTMVAKNSTILFTNAKISTIRLSLFQPRMPLSDNFRYVIDNMPCCSYSVDVQTYIFENIFNYFGFTYVKDLLLGGIAQQKIVITEEDRSTLMKYHFDMSNSAEVSGAAGDIFSASVSMKITQQTDTEKLNIFKKYSKQSSVTTLGGDSSIQTFADWSKTVPTNPIVIKFSIGMIFDLFTKDKFPNEPKLAEKMQLIRTALDAYTQNPIFCYNNCSGKGTCKSSGYFQFGLCECASGWTGIDCSVAIPSPPKQNILQGTICGLRTGAGMDCDTINPLDGCPAGYSRNEWAISKTGTGRMQFCSKDGTDTLQGRIGTICGFATGGTGYPCGGLNPFSDGCPAGYQQYQWLTDWGSGITAWCYKTNATLDDLPGTLCGMQTNDGLTGPTCQGYYPARGSCPSGYTLLTWAVSFGNGRWSFCFKI